MARLTTSRSRVAPLGRATERNRLLLALPLAEYAALQPLLEQRDVGVKELVYEAGRPIAFVYFPQSSVMSVMIGMGQGRVPVEVATIGREGFVGLPLVLDTDHDTTRALVQVAGAVRRMRASDFRQLLRRGGRLPALLLRYTQVMISHIVQTAACKLSHSVSQRCACCLLLTQDRVGHDQFELTQEFLSSMIGVHRPSVNVAAGILRAAGFISYQRGRIHVRDRAGLESAACECHGIMVREYDHHLRSVRRSRTPVR